MQENLLKFLSPLQPHIESSRIFAANTTAHLKQTATAKPAALDSEFVQLVQHGSPLLSLPPELHLQILNACVTEVWDYGSPHRPPLWHLSHTIPQSLLLTSKYIRNQAFNALATFADLYVGCNVETSGDVYPRDVASGVEETLPPRRTLQTMIDASSSSCLRKVKKQCTKLPAARLCLKFQREVDDDQEYSLIDDLEAIRRCLVCDVFVATEQWPRWRHINIDFGDMDEAMRIRQNSDSFLLDDFEFDNFIGRAWNVIVDELMRLIANTHSLEIGLLGWREDRILEKLQTAAGTKEAGVTAD